MLKLICDKNEKFDVSRIEIDSDRPLYTIETLKSFQKLYPENEISFIIGSDNLKELCTWNNSNELVKDFKIYVLERSYDDIKNIINSNDFLKNNSSAFIKAKNTIVSNLSSTFIRDKIRNGKSVRYLTPDEVISYINNNNLYK